MENEFNIDEDALYVVRLKAGDHEAYEYLFRKYYASICAYARRFVDADEVEDIADECMIWLWAKHESLEIRNTFRQYLFTMVYHRAVKVAVERRIADRTATYMEDYRLRYELNEEDFLTGKELRERIFKAIDKLPDTYKDAFIQHRFEGKSYKEIAEECGMSVKTVDYRIQQALKQLRKDLSDYLPVVAVIVIMSYLETDINHKSMTDNSPVEVNLVV